MQKYLKAADFSGIGALKGLYSSLVNTFLPIIMMLFIFGIILGLLVGGGFFLKSVLNLAYSPTHNIRKVRLGFLAVPLLLLLAMSMSLQGGHAATNITGVTATVGADSVMVGVPFTVQIEGLTAASTYAVRATHSAGNITRWITPSSTTANVDFIFESVDSDDQVPIYVYSTSSGSILHNATTYPPTTIYVQLSEPNDYIDSSFFLLVVVPLVIIGIVLVLVKKFI